MKLKTCGCGRVHNIEDIILQISGVYTEWNELDCFLDEHLVEFKCACNSSLTISPEDLEV